jgi:peptide/nickel transport system substrate-binding protein
VLQFGVSSPKTSEARAGVRAFISNLLSEGLVGMGWDGRPVARLAVSSDWKENGLVLELRLRPNLKFHDGTLVDNVFVANSLKQTFKSPTAVSYRSVTSVEPFEGDGVRVRLSRPEALLLADLSNSTLSIPGKPDIGMGPYRLIERGAKTKLASFAEYYRGKPRIDALEIQEYEEQRASWAALMRGQLDAVHEIVPGAVDFVQAEGQTNVRTFPFTRPYYIQLLFNVNHPILKDRRVRQALSYGVDRQAIINLALNKQGTVAEGPIWPFHWAYSTAQKSYTHNTEAATLRLDAAGLRIKDQREPGRMPSRLRFRCLTLAKDSRYEKIAMVLQKQLYEIGVDMEIEAISLEDLRKRSSSGDFDAILAERTSGRSLAWTYMSFHSTFMPVGYKSADAVLDRLRTAQADGDVRATVSDLQQVFHDDPPAIFIAWPTVARVVSTKFQVPEEGGRDVLSSLWQWRPAATSK